MHWRPRLGDHFYCGNPPFYGSDSFSVKCHGRQLAPGMCSLGGGSVCDVVVQPGQDPHVGSHARPLGDSCHRNPSTSCHATRPRPSCREPRTPPPRQLSQEHINILSCNPAQTLVSGATPAPPGDSCHRNTSTSCRATRPRPSCREPRPPPGDSCHRNTSTSCRSTAPWLSSGSPLRVWASLAVRQQTGFAEAGSRLPQPLSLLPRGGKPRHS